MAFNIEEQLKLLPDSPGVYLMHNKNGKIIYVGKAKVLKNRVRQYFQNNQTNAKTIALVRNIAWFEYIVTDSEVEALILENNLIKKHKPRYNILLKDDKSYPYIKVTLNRDYPKIFMTRRLEKDGAKYFGPYASNKTVKNTIEVVRRIFSPATCNRRFPQDIGKGRPCLNYSIKRCVGVCTGNVSQAEYKKLFDDICAFLDGDNDGLIKSFTQKMLEASANLQFERAAQYRDKIQAIEKLNESQKIIDTESGIDKDVIAVGQYDTTAFIEVFFIREAKVIGRESHTMALQDVDVALEDIESKFIEQFYSDRDYVPKEIYLQHRPSDEALLTDWLSKKRGNKVSVFVPKRGEKADLVAMVNKNVVQAIDEYKIQELKNERDSQILTKLADYLGMDTLPKRIESYDISNISGSDNVGAMAVFINGKSAPSQYRKFRIKYVEGADDYQSMQEVLYRRFTNMIAENTQIAQGSLDSKKARFNEKPDLILIDGGKGHLHAAMEVLHELDINIPAFGMVKDDKHKTRALVGDGGEIGISPASSVFNLIGRIQDETHNTAIGYYRQLHQKRLSFSQLDDIKGVGKAKKSILLREFKTLTAIKNADLQALESVKGIDKTTAKNIYDYFSKEDQTQ